MTKISIYSWFHQSTSLSFFIPLFMPTDQGPDKCSTVLSFLELWPLNFTFRSFTSEPCMLCQNLYVKSYNLVSLISYISSQLATIENIDDFLNLYISYRSLQYTETKGWWRHILQLQITDIRHFNCRYGRCQSSHNWSYSITFWVKNSSSCH